MKPYITRGMITSICTLVNALGETYYAWVFSQYAEKNLVSYTERLFCVFHHSAQKCILLRTRL